MSCIQVDASKAPGYRGGGGGCSPCSRTSSHGSTPPPPPPPPYHHPLPIGNTVNAMDMSGLSRNGPIYQENPRNGHNMMVGMSSGVSGVSSVSGVSGVSLGMGYVGVEGVSRLNPRAPDFAQRHPLLQQQQQQQQQHKHAAQQLFPGGSGSNLSSMLAMYPQSAPKMTHAPHAHHPYQSLIERGVGVGGVGSWGEEEERKPRPIGTERAWKLTAPDDWHHAHHAHHHHRTDHDRYQQQNMNMGGMGVGVGVGVGEAYGGAAAGGATAAALSMIHTLPLQYLPPDHHHWDQPPHHANDKQQAWSKWSH
ncbi:unnamed protein product [Euphydryas editha]|uniref:Uncharacterized protein n=1 Tax=Euphydryas editha TaxID=104508 RepID=A0AAU9TGP2_EUPED|nr:unnamed protein product [Euphydryas editha]